MKQFYLWASHLLVLFVRLRQSLEKNLRERIPFAEKLRSILRFRESNSSADTMRNTQPNPKKIFSVMNKLCTTAGLCIILSQAYSQNERADRHF